MRIILVLASLIALSAGFAPEPEALRRLKLNPIFPNGRIVGGEDTDIRDIPYQVALEYRGSHFCGGTLISDEYVLTAGHCIISTANNINIRVGSSKRGFDGKTIALSALYRHPKYSDQTLDYDVAILRLASKAPLSENVKPIAPADGEPNVNTWFKVSGWGLTKEDGEVSEQLKSVLIPVMDRASCVKMYSAFRINITSRMICAYMLGKDACQGDSGGPAIATGNVAGIVSWGVGCARPNYPGVYTNVADPEIRNFIRSIAKV